MIVDNGGDELEFLGHTLGKFLHLFVPPVLYAEAHEPILQGNSRIGGAHSLEPGEVNRLFAYFHLAVKASFLRHITYLLDIRLSDGSPLEEHLAGIRNRNSVYNADKRGFSCTVGTQQTENLTLGNIQIDILNSNLFTERFADVFTFDY